MLNPNLERLNRNFDEKSKIDKDNGIEFWYSRELIKASDHFRQVTKMVELGSGAKWEIMNAD